MKKFDDHHSHCCGLCRVEIENLSVTAEKELILSDITTHIHCGEVTALIGPNGAGKTTFIKALLNQTPHTGIVRHVNEHGQEVKGLKIGYVPQQLPFDRQMPVTVCDLMAASLTRRPVWTGVSKKTKAAMEQALSIAKAESLIDKPLGNLSGGELQRVLLALALSPMPQVLILDEPVSGVDQNGLQLFLSAVEELKNTCHMAILLVSHDWLMVQRYADRAILLDKTVLCTGSPDVIFKSPQFAEAFPAVPFTSQTE